MYGFVFWPLCRRQSCKDPCEILRGKSEDASEYRQPLGRAGGNGHMLWNENLKEHKHETEELLHTECRAKTFVQLHTPHSMTL